MYTINILLAGVGGQGLVLTTKLISEVALSAGYDVKTNDVVGMSQRGGKVWGNIRIGKNVYSPNIPPKGTDYLLAMEPLEGERWSGDLRDDGTVIVNTYVIPPTPVLMEQVEYPSDIIGELSKKYEVIALDATEKGNAIGNTKVANTILVGILASRLDIDKELWIEGIKNNVPKKFTDLNIEAFEFGLSYKV